MEPDTAMSETVSADNAEKIREHPQLTEWLWRPWYAKLWWVGVAVYWAGKLVSYWSSPLDDLYATVLAGYLNILFYPLTPLMMLGIGFLRAWMDFRGLEWGPPTHDQLFPKRSLGGWRDPASDPLDPRSGLIHWRHFHPDQ